MHKVDLRSDDGYCETGSVQPASGAKRCSIGDLIALAVTAETLPGVAGAVAKGSVDIASAAGCTIAGKNCDSNHGTAAKDIEDQAKESEESLSAKAASEDDGEDGVENGSARQTSDGLLPARNRDIAISLDREEVRVDSEDDRSAAKFEGIESRCEKSQRSSAESHCRGLGID